MAVVAAFAVVWTPAQARACTCAAPRTDVATEVANVDLVVEARVDSHVFVREVGFRTRLTVTKTHKGARMRKLIITAAKTCAVGFEVGTRYLVYAHRDGEGKFGTTYCSRTAPLSEAGRDLEVLKAAAESGGTESAAAATRPPPLLPDGWERAILARVIAFLERVLAGA